MNAGAGVVLAAFLGILPGLIAQRKGRCFIDWWLYGTGLFAVALVHSLLLRPQRTACICKGVFLLATGRPAGLQNFDGTTPRFLASLASLLLWPAIGVAALIAGSGGPAMLADVMASLCCVLAPPVITYELATLWDRTAQWPRFATAFNWCQWALPVVGLILITVAGGLTRGGLPSDVVLTLLVCAFSAYGLWLHWFVACHGLAVSRLRAALLVAAVNTVTVLLVLLPHLLIQGRA